MKTGLVCNWDRREMKDVAHKVPIAIVDGNGGQTPAFACEFQCPECGTKVYVTNAPEDDKTPALAGSAQASGN